MEKIFVIEVESAESPFSQTTPVVVHGAENVLPAIKKEADRIYEIKYISTLTENLISMAAHQILAPGETEVRVVRERGVFDIEAKITRVI